MSDELTPGRHEWLGKRVRVGAGCAPEVTMAEGTVVGYLSAPSVIVRDAQGRDSTWMVTLPIDVLGEASPAELRDLAQLGPMARAVDTRLVSEQLLAGLHEVVADWLLSPEDNDRETLNKIHRMLAGVSIEATPVDTGSRNLELRSQIYEFLGSHTAQITGAQHDHESLRRLSDKLAQRIEQLPTPMEDRLAEILRGAGIEYPLGLRGVRDLIQQRDGHLERAQEAEDLASRTHESMMAKYAEAGELRERAEQIEQQLTIDRREHGRSLDAVQRRLEQATSDRDRVLAANSQQAGMIHERDRKLRVAHERAEAAERRLANVREMVGRLRRAAGGGVTPGYVLVRVEDMLNGQEPT